MIDLHLHLDGSLSPQLVKRLAQRQGISLPAGEGPGWKLSFPCRRTAKASMITCAALICRWRCCKRQRR